MKHLILLWGFNRHGASYKAIVNTAPLEWQIHQFPYRKIIPSGKTDELHQSLLNYLKEKGLKKVYLMGHSLGGGLALDFAIHHPKRVEELYLVDSAGVYDKNSVLKGFLNVTRYGTHSPKELHKNLKELIQTLRNPILYTKLGWYAHHIDLTEQANSLKVPTVIFWGENDRITPLWQGQKLNQAISGSKLIILKNEGHDWVLKHPEKFWSNVVE
jgi:2-hydroxy-6-oxonona-2,4-dienedioate hydrolase